MGTWSLCVSLTFALSSILRCPKTHLIELLSGPTQTSSYHQRQASHNATVINNVLMSYNSWGISQCRKEGQKQSSDLFSKGPPISWRQRLTSEVKCTAAIMGSNTERQVSGLFSHVIIPLMTLGTPLNSSSAFKGASKSPSRCSGQGEQTTYKFCGPGAGAYENSLHPREGRKQGCSRSLQQCYSSALAHAVVWRHSGMLVNAWVHRTSANWNLHSIC